MKTFQLPVFVVLLQAYLATADVYHITVDGDVEITQNGRKIEYKEPDCDEDGPWSCQASKICNDKRVWSLDANGDHAACCLHNQHLSGTAETEFFCCGEEHSVAGSDDVGYSCCPDGQDYDGEVCKEVCKNGKKLVDGECVCPKGTVEGDDGKCKKKKKDDDPKRCTSGLETGKCYTLLAENGNLISRDGHTIYSASPQDINHRWAKLQLCKDELCKPGKPVNPSDRVYIRDIHGNVITGKETGQWLDDRSNSGHIRATDDFDKAGEFALTKWPCGKYCLGGFEWGLGPACPAKNPALTFYENDPQMCVMFELTEVPCDIKNDKNNCIWTNGDDQCCDKMHCPT